MTVAALVGADEVLTDSLDLDASLGEFQVRLSMIFGRARAQWKESAARVHPDLQPAGYKLLSFIARSEQANAHQLADLFEMDKSVISRQVRALEEWGLVVSRPDDRDARQRVLTATPAAQAQGLALPLGDVTRPDPGGSSHPGRVALPVHLRA